MLSSLRSSSKMMGQAALRRQAMSTWSKSSIPFVSTASTTNARLASLLLVGAGGAVLLASSSSSSSSSSSLSFPLLMTTPQCTAMAASRVPLGGDIISTGKPVTETATGILFPQLCNGYFLVGCGVRIKYGFIKIYALGTYLDPLAMSAVKNSDKGTIQQALCDPTYPRTIRIVMARGLSVDKFTAAICEALEPRMKGKDLEKLEEFKTLNPPLDLVKGAEIELTIRGDTLLYKNAVGGVGTIRSEIFTAAMCDTFYGDDAVSPTHKDAVLDGVKKL